MRAIAYIGKEDFGRAIADLKQGLESQPESPQDWSLLCLSEKAAGREDDCLASCDAMFRLFDQTEDPDEANLLAWTWALGPGGDSGRVRALRAGCPGRRGTFGLAGLPAHARHGPLPGRTTGGGDRRAHADCASD